MLIQDTFANTVVAATRHFHLNSIDIVRIILPKYAECKRLTDFKCMHHSIDVLNIIQEV